MERELANHRITNLSEKDDSNYFKGFPVRCLAPAGNLSSLIPCEVVSSLSRFKINQVLFKFSLNIYVWFHHHLSSSVEENFTSLHSTTSTAKTYFIIHTNDFNVYWIHLHRANSTYVKWFREKFLSSFVVGTRLVVKWGHQALVHRGTRGWLIYISSVTTVSSGARTWCRENM